MPKKEGTKKIKKKKVVKKTIKKVVKKKKTTPKEKKVKTLKKTIPLVTKEKKVEILKQPTSSADKVQNENIDIKEKKEKPIEKNRSFDYSKYESNNSANIWLWGGITIILIFMVVIWLMTAKLQIENYDKLQGDDSDLIQKTQENWDNAFAKTQEKETTKQTIKEQIENILKEFNNTVNETASTPTSTLEFSTSTPLEFSTSTENLTGQATSTNS